MEWFASKWRFVAALFIAAVVAYLSYLDWQTQSAARAGGVEACTRLGHPAETCKSAVTEHDAACAGLTGSTDALPNRRELVDPERYVECVLEGPGPFKRRMLQRQAEAKREGRGLSQTATRTAP